MTFREDSKLMSAYGKVTKKCPKCGHSFSFKQRGLEKIDCSWCGSLIFKSEKAKNEWEQKKFRCTLKNVIRKISGE